jgi:hypothetical protein
MLTGVERLLRNAALRNVARVLPVNAVNSLTQMTWFDTFARSSFDNADMDGDGR